MAATWFPDDSARMDDIDRRLDALDRRRPVIDPRFTTGRPWLDVSAFARGGTGTRANPWYGWEGVVAKLAATTDLRDGANFPIYLPAGFHRLDGFTSTNSSSHFVVQGAGKHATTIVGSGEAAIKLTNARNVAVRDLAIMGDPADPFTYGVQIHRTAGLVGLPGPTAVQLEHVWIGGTETDSIGTAVAFTADVDANSDVGTFTDVEILNVGTGYSFRKVNTLWHTLIGGNVSFCSVAAIDSTPDGVAFGGSYKALSTVFSGNTVTFKVGPTTGINDNLLYGISGESEQRLVQCELSGDETVRMRFFGGHISAFDPGAGDTVTWDVPSAASVLEFDGFSLASPNGVRINQPTSGRIRVTGGNYVTAEWRYNGLLEHMGHTESAGAPAFTNLGSGRMRVFDEHIAAAGSAAVSPAQGGAVGVGGSVTISGSDTAGTLTITTGAVPATGPITQVFFNRTWPVAPTMVISPADADAAAEWSKFHTGAVTTASWNLEARDTLTALTMFNVNYLIVGR